MSMLAPTLLTSALGAPSLILWPCCLHIAGLPSLLHGPAGACQLWLSPVCDQQRIENVGLVLSKFSALGVLPPQGQVGLFRRLPLLLYRIYCCCRTQH